jgi:uncharacterized protein RhaS with RHS repeats
MSSTVDAGLPATLTAAEQDEIFNEVEGPRPTAGADIAAAKRKQAIQDWKARSNAGNQRRYDERGNAMRAVWSARARADYQAKATAEGRSVRSYTRQDTLTDVERVNRETTKQREKKQRYRAKKKAADASSMAALPLYGRF